MTKRIDISSGAPIEENQYVLGTDEAEMFRLGIQHQIWAEEARKGWEKAEFGPGHTILDLACGPGFASQDLAYIVGTSGKVIGVDRSKIYLDFLDRVAKLHHLNIETQHADFDHMQLQKNSLDGVFERWGLPWIANPEEIIEKVVEAMRPGAAFVSHEYFDWTTHQTHPSFPNLAAAIQAGYDSFQQGPGDIEIGKRLPGLFYDAGLEVISVRPMPKLGSPDDFVWQWPATFYEVYFPKLVELGLLTKDQMESAYEEIDEFENTEGSLFFGPMMMEIIAIKP
ncbi:MAG: methyltransferase domain-containing protein [Bacteroidota bacterium]